MLRITTFLILAAALAATPSAARANDAAERKDRATYNKLVRQIRVAKSKLNELEGKAVEMAHRDGGQAPDPIKAEILSVQDEIDRKTNRLELITLRHGWEVPDFSQDHMNTSGVPAPRVARRIATVVSISRPPRAPPQAGV